MKRVFAIAFPFLGCLFLFQLLPGALSSVSAQESQPHRTVKSFDLETLRRDFVAAVGKDFDVVKDEMKLRSASSGGGTYWLAHIKPKHPGQFKLTYRYNYNDAQYSHVEREFGLAVGRKGCRRGVPASGSYHRFCVGDTIIFPVAVYNFTEHEFTLTSSEYTPEQDAIWERVAADPADDQLDRLHANNPVADYMRFVGSSSSKMLHRNGGYTLEHYAVFEAEPPGRFNLALGLDLPGIKKLATYSAGEGVPIIIVARDTPLALLASQHELRGYTIGFNGKEYCSSWSGAAFMTDVMILQPGDRLSLKYETRVVSWQSERTERAGDGLNPANDSPSEPPPLITKLPFALNTEYNYSEWLANYLPR